MTKWNVPGHKIDCRFSGLFYCCCSLQANLRHTGTGRRYLSDIQNEWLFTSSIIFWWIKYKYEIMITPFVVHPSEQNSFSRLSQTSWLSWDELFAFLGRRGRFPSANAPTEKMEGLYFHSAVPCKCRSAHPEQLEARCLPHMDKKS